MTLLQIADNPNNTVYFNREALIRGIVSDLDDDEDTILNTKEQIAQMQAQQQQQPNPDAQKLELEKYKVDTEAAIKREQIQANAQAIEIQGKIDLLLEQMRRDRAIAVAAADERMTVADLQAKLQMHDRDKQVQELIAQLDAQTRQASKVIESRDKRFVAGMKAETDAAQIADRAASRAIQIQVESPNPRIAQ